MALATSNFSSWGLIEDLLVDTKNFEDSAAYTSITNKADNMASFLFSNDSWSGTSTQLNYAGLNYRATLNGSNFGKSNFKITSGTITDQSGNSLTLTGEVTASSEKIKSINGSIDGYSESLLGTWYMDSSKDAVVTSWTMTFPLLVGDVTIVGTGKRTYYSDTDIKTEYKTINITYGNYSASISKLKYTTYGDPAALDYLQMLEGFFSGDDKLTGSNGEDEIRGYAGNDTLTGKGGDDVLVGGAGSDKFIVDSGNDFVTDFGDGADILTVSSGAVAEVTVVNDWVANSKTVNKGQANFFTDGYNVNFSSIKSGQGFQLTNVGGASNLIGSQKDDLIYGGTGSDSINGQLGNDQLNGGAGSDEFVFNTKLSAKNNIDQIMGFEQRSDIIILDHKIFKSFKQINIAVPDENIYILGSDRDLDGKNDFLVYDPETGALSYDADGSSGKAAIQFATLVLGEGQQLNGSDLFII